MVVAANLVATNQVFVKVVQLPVPVAHALPAKQSLGDIMLYAEYYMM